MKGNWLTVADVAKRERVTPNRIRQLLAAGRFTPAPVMIGRAWLIPSKYSITTGARGPRRKATTKGQRK